MPLKLMYITNQPMIARIAEAAGVDRIFVDMEYIGKSLRQGGMDTVQSHHTFADIASVKKIVNKAELLVRCNPIHDATQDYSSSEEEIEEIIRNGADIIMLPYFKTPEEVRRFIGIVTSRAKKVLLLETPEAVDVLDEILEIEGIDEIHIGLNDLSLGYKLKFMFELLSDGTIEKIATKIKSKGIPFGFGGIASLGKGLLSAERIIMEHYRLGSGAAILSRSFCDASKIADQVKISEVFETGVKEIREYEKFCLNHVEEWEENRLRIVKAVSEIVERTS